MLIGLCHEFRVWKVHPVGQIGQGFWLFADRNVQGFCHQNVLIGLFRNTLERLTLKSPGYIEIDRQLFFGQRDKSEQSAALDSDSKVTLWVQNVLMH